MTLTLVLPPEIEAKLKEQAAREGKDPQTFVLEALEQTLSGESTASAVSLPAAAWHSRFDALLHSLPRSKATVVDDSRETIYNSRGV
jgi:predicted DNA-binding protein